MCALGNEKEKHNASDVNNSWPFVTIKVAEVDADSSMMVNCRHMFAGRPGRPRAKTGWNRGHVAISAHQFKDSGPAIYNAFRVSCLLVGLVRTDFKRKM